MTTSNSRAQAILDKLQATVGLTDEGRCALVQLTNPFTDFEQKRVGFFDANQSASVVQCVKKSMVVTAPASAAGGNWDCNIFTLPFLGSVDAPNFVDNGVYAGSGLLGRNGVVANTNTMGPVNVLRGPAGTNLSLATHGPLVDCNGTLLALGEADFLLPGGATASFLDGTSRCIGMGFEVHNTTAEIYKQGAAAVYQVPQNHMLDRTNRNMILTQSGSPLSPLTFQVASGLSTQTIHDAPETLASVLLLAGSRQWEASAGCMNVPTLITPEIPPVRRESVVPVIVTDSPAGLTVTFPSGGGTANVDPACSPFINIVTGTPIPQTTAVYRKANKFINFNTSGTLFTGLSNQTTLVVNVIYYVERFPAPTEVDLVVLAQPSPPSDPVAAELYSILMRMMPPGVRVTDNASGDWFYNLISGAAKFIKPALMAAGPLGMAGSVIAEGAQQWAEGKLAEGKKKKKPVPKKNAPAGTKKPPQLPPRPHAPNNGNTWKGKGKKAA